AARAYQAVWALASAPEQAVPLFRERLQKVPATDQGQRIARLIADLDSDEFAVREGATRELQELGRAAEQPLRQALTKGLSLEARRRVEQVLDKLKAEAASPDALRAPRAVEVLELIGTPEARKVLEEWAGGAPEAVLTQEAKASLERL